MKAVTLTSLINSFMKRKILRQQSNSNREIIEKEVWPPHISSQPNQTRWFGSYQPLHMLLYLLLICTQLSCIHSCSFHSNSLVKIINRSTVIDEPLLNVLVKFFLFAMIWAIWIFWWKESYGWLFFFLIGFGFCDISSTIQFVMFVFMLLSKCFHRPMVEFPKQRRTTAGSSSQSLYFATLQLSTASKPTMIGFSINYLIWK